MLEAVDARGTRALGDCSAQWLGDVLRLVRGALPVMPAHQKESTKVGTGVLGTYRTDCNADHSALKRQSIISCQLSAHSRLQTSQ